MSGQLDTSLALPVRGGGHFERVLSGEPFTGLEAIFNSLSSDREALYEAVKVVGIRA